MGSISPPIKFRWHYTFVCQVHTCKIRWQLSKMANWYRRTVSTFLLLLLLLPSLPNSPVQSTKPQLQANDSIPPNLWWISRTAQDWLCADSCDVWMEGIMKWEWKWVEWGQSKKKKLCNFAWNFVLLEFFVAILTCIYCWWWWFHQHFHSRRQTWLMSADCWSYGKKSVGNYVAQHYVASCTVCDSAVMAILLALVCRTETMRQLLCLKSKFSNHFAFTLGRYLFLLFWV